MRTKQKIMKKSLTLGVVLLTAIMLSFASSDLFNHDASAETFESAQGISFTFNPTVKITITGGTGASSDGLTIDNLTPGDYKDSNIITVTAGSNSPLGYTLSSTVGSSTYNSTELRRGGTETANKFTNLTTNKASLSAFDPGYWGYSYSTNSGSTWISGDIVSGTSAGYNGLPIYTTASPIKLINSSTASESSVQFKIGARATSSQTSGTYSNVVNFIGVAKVVTTTYTINYNANAGSDTVTNMPTPNPLQGTDTTGNAAIQIPSNVPVRANYMFKGWCTSQTSDDTCSSDVVQPGGYVALNPGTSSATATVTKNLYAMWKSNSAGPVIVNTTCATPVPSGITYMQELADSTKKSAALSSMTQGSQYYLVDERDNQGYCVSKQADGNIWMTQNLDLDIGGTGVATLTSENTDLNTSGSAPYVDGYSTSGGVITWSPASTATTSGRTISGTTVTGWTNNNSAPYSAEGGDRYYYTTGTTSNETAQTLAQCKASHSEEDCAHYHSGNYYNWTAAIASNTSSGIGSPSYAVAANSICPKGWKLPQGRTSTTTPATRQFGNLWYESGIITSVSGSSYDTDGFNKIRTSPLYFVRGGYVRGSSLNFGGSNSYSWSSSVDSTSYAYSAYFSSSTTNSASNYNRYDGQPVRCMVR